jgi:hypothetical protein
VIDAIRAVEAAGFSERGDFYHTLAACFISRPEHRQVYDQVFRLYWRDPRFLEHMMGLMLPSLRGVAEERQAQAAEKRAAEALLDGVPREQPDLPEEEAAGEEIEIDASFTHSGRERLKTLDFEQMSTAEIAEAKRMLARLSLPVKPLRARRMRADRYGRLPDWRATIRSALRQGGEIRDFSQKNRRTRWPNLVVLCDISGSMAPYSRAFLQFLYGAVGGADAEAFVFATRLTRLTRALAAKQPQLAIERATAAAGDWSGGTRIAAALHSFNEEYGRRGMARGAVVLILSDGWEREDPERVGGEMAALRRLAYRIVWVNPRKASPRFTPLAGGMAAALPYCDALLSGHSVSALESVVEAIGEARMRDGV